MSENQFRSREREKKIFISFENADVVVDVSTDVVADVGGVDVGSGSGDIGVGAKDCLFCILLFSLFSTLK